MTSATPPPGGSGGQPPKAAGVPAASPSAATPAAPPSSSAPGLVAAPAAAAQSAGAAAPAQAAPPAATVAAAPAAGTTGGGTPLTAGRPTSERPKPGPVRRFFRSVVSHLVFAAVVSLGVLGYVFHREILRDVGDQVCAEDRLGQFMSVKPAALRGGSAATTPPVQTTSPVAATPAAETQVPAAAKQLPSAEETEVPRPPAVAVTVAPVEPAPAKPAAPEPKPAPAATAARPEPTPPPSHSFDGTSTGALPSTAAPPMPPAAPATPPQRQPVSQQAGLSAPPGASAAFEATGSGLSLAKAWQAAREAVIARKPEAVAAYRDLAAQYPDMPDITGELGNVLYGEGRYAEAADQYLETASRLVRQNRAAEASCLADVLVQIAPDKAERLRAMTQATCPRHPASQ